MGILASILATLGLSGAKAIAGAFLRRYWKPLACGLVVLGFVIALGIQTARLHSAQGELKDAALAHEQERSAILQRAAEDNARAMAEFRRHEDIKARHAREAAEHLADYNKELEDALREARNVDPTIDPPVGPRTAIVLERLRALQQREAASRGRLPGNATARP